MGSLISCVDAFTDRPFKGNQAAVCVLDKPRSQTWMQNLAAEMNLAETAFVITRGKRIQLRWFTPTVEMPLCGHATLASAHVLWSERRRSTRESIRFETLSGTLTATRRGKLIELDFPAERAEPVEPPAGLARALGVAPVWFGRNRLDYIVEVATESEVRELQPDLTALAALDTRGVIVTARSSAKPYDFISRFFAPGVGIPEDPVTGSAHCCLAPYWGTKLKKDVMLGYQASPRGGKVRVELAGSRVLLSGSAVTIYRGTLTV